MARFVIEYVEPNLPDEVWRRCEVEFEDWFGVPTLNGEPAGKPMVITARQWAEDAASALADKGPYRITEIA